MIKKIAIPFDGFYESFAMHSIESAAEMMEANDYSVDFKSFAKNYVDLYTDWLENDPETPLKMEFIELYSPREYNFETDKIYCEIEVNDLVTFHLALLADEEAQERINDRFKSRSGFASFYGEFCIDWKTKALADWDENELSILLPTPDYSFFYDDANCNGEITDCIIED